MNNKQLLINRKWHTGGGWFSKKRFIKKNFKSVVFCDHIETTSSAGDSIKVYYANDGDVAALFDEMYYKGNCMESIFELQFDIDKGNPFVEWFRSVLGYIQANTANINIEYFPSSQIDRKWRDIRPDIAVKQGAIWKWIGLSQTGLTYRPETASNSNWIFYRLADIMLIKAEALTQLAFADNDREKLKEALDLVRQIRTRANAPESTDMLYGQNENDVSARTLEEFILNERGRELLFEGKRWFDVLRYVKRDDFRNRDYLQRFAVLSTSPEKISILQEKWINHEGSLYMPIYYSEIEMNENLNQNEFYK
ncbi:MAG: RagB/SusD family nutrient uptake outer membrane protein [Bacteroidales bacterium]|jgi:hypothetical protein|nr:RagB/SusD family nutrient uptake outer membrane protein [Bacteroidales bacterium]